MADLQQEHHREIEGLLENIRQLSRELRLQMLIIDNFIPQDYQVCVGVCVFCASHWVQMEFVWPCQALCTRVWLRDINVCLFVCVCVCESLGYMWVTRGCYAWDVFCVSECVGVDLRFGLPENVFVCATGRCVGPMEICSSMCDISFVNAHCVLPKMTLNFLIQYVYVIYLNCCNRVCCWPIFFNMNCKHWTTLKCTSCIHEYILLFFAALLLMFFYYCFWW